MKENQLIEDHFATSVGKVEREKEKGKQYRTNNDPSDLQVRTGANVSTTRRSWVVFCLQTEEMLCQ